MQVDTVSSRDAGIGELETRRSRSRKCSRRLSGSLIRGFLRLVRSRIAPGEDANTNPKKPRPVDRRAEPPRAPLRGTSVDGSLFRRLTKANDVDSLVHGVCASPWSRSRQARDHACIAPVSDSGRRSASFYKRRRFTNEALNMRHDQVLRNHSPTHSLHPTIHPGHPAQCARNHPGPGLSPAHGLGPYGRALAYGAGAGGDAPRLSRQRRQLPEIRGDDPHAAPGGRRQPLHLRGRVLALAAPERSRRSSPSATWRRSRR